MTPLEQIKLIISEKGRCYRIDDDILECTDCYFYKKTFYCNNNISNDLKLERIKNFIGNKYKRLKEAL